MKKIVFALWLLLFCSITFAVKRIITLKTPGEEATIEWRVVNSLDAVKVDSNCMEVYGQVYKQDEAGNPLGNAEVNDLYVLTGHYFSLLARQLRISNDPYPPYLPAAGKLTVKALPYQACL